MHHGYAPMNRPDTVYFTLLLSHAEKAASAKPFAHFHAAEAQFPARHQTEMTRHAPRDDRPTRRVKDMERPSFHGKNDQTGLPRLAKTKAGKQP